MERYLSWSEVLQHLKIKDFQLLELIDGGLVPYIRYNAVPIRTVNRKNLPDGFLNSIGRLPTREELRGVHLVVMKRYACFVYERFFPMTKDILKHLPKYIIENMVQALLPLKHRSQKNKPRKSLDYDDETMEIDFKKPESFQQLDKLDFRIDDIEAIEKQNGLALDEQKVPPIRETLGRPAPPSEQTDPKAFIRDLQIAYESDTEISVKVGTKKQKTYSFTDMGFGREDTKAWRALIQILGSPDHSYHLGAANGEGKRRNPTYDKNRAILREISKKIVSSLNKSSRLQLPDNFQMFELNKSERPGTYLPKFAIPVLSMGDADYNDLSRDTLIADIEKLSSRKDVLDSRGDQDSEKKLSRIMSELEEKISIACKKDWLGKNRAASYLNPPTED